MSKVFNEIKDEEKYIKIPTEKKGIGSRMDFQSFMTNLSKFQIEDVSYYIFISFQ